VSDERAFWTEELERVYASWSTSDERAEPEGMTRLEEDETHRCLVHTQRFDQGHRIKIGGLGRMANSAFGGKLNLCGTCSHLVTMFVVYLVVDNKYNVYVR